MDARVDAAPQLRSLRIGEIFDRATTFFVRNFVVFSLIMLTLEAPLGILRFIGGGGRSDYSALIQQLAHPMQRSAAAPVPGQIASTIALVLASVIFAPFVNNAIACGVAAIYAGERPTYGSAFAPVLRRVFPMLMTLLLCIAIGIGLYVVFFLLVLLTALIATGLSGGGAVIPAIVAIVVLAIAAIFAAVLVVISCEFALYASTLEQFPPGKSIATGFARIFNRRELGKACLMTLAYIALEFAVLIVTGSVALLLASVPFAGDVLQVTFTTVTGAVLAAFIATLVAVYYFDVRTRAEGLDLEVDLERLSPQA
jgi:hypothetical protein